MQEKIRRVLVTTDFSELADHAIGHAFRIAADHKGEVLLCHVIEMAPPPNPLYAHYYPTDLLNPKTREAAGAHAQQSLLERAPKTSALASVPHRAIVVHGSVVDEILRVASEENADLLVISTHGRTGLKHVFLGSVVEQVIRRAHCAVLVVR